MFNSDDDKIVKKLSIFQLVIDYLVEKINKYRKCFFFPS